MNVNYRWKKHYKTAKYPIRQPAWLTWVIYILSKICLIGKKYTLETIDMEGLEPPYIIFSNHQAFIDFELAAMVTHPRKVNNVVNIDGYHMMPWLLTWIGSICTRKFTNDIHLVKSIRRVIQNGDILCMYPEARYTPIGTTSYLPDSLGRLVKMNKVPLVVVTHHGNYLYSPFWAYKNKRKVHHHTVFRQVLTAEQISQMTPDEINAVIREAMQYDEYRYQLESGIRIAEPNRAEGLQKVLTSVPTATPNSRWLPKGQSSSARAAASAGIWKRTVSSPRKMARPSFPTFPTGSSGSDPRSASRSLRAPTATKTSWMCTPSPAATASSRWARPRYATASRMALPSTVITVARITTSTVLPRV